MYGLIIYVCIYLCVYFCMYVWYVWYVRYVWYVCMYLYIYICMYVGWYVPHIIFIYLYIPSHFLENLIIFDDHERGMGCPPTIIHQVVEFVNSQWSLLWATQCHLPFKGMVKSSQKMVTFGGWFVVGFAVNSSFCLFVFGQVQPESSRSAAFK